MKRASDSGRRTTHPGQFRDRRHRGLPKLLDSYRRLQSGKRHARLDIDEALESKADADPPAITSATLNVIEKQLAELSRMQAELRQAADALYNTTH
jgi:hypothetical protein